MQYVNSVNCDPCGTDGVQGICAAGYHIPSDLEWSHYEWCVENDPGYTLSYFQNSTGWRGSIVGQKLKATSSNTPPWNGTNASGFTALPAGGRGNGGGFNYLGSFAYFWSATEASATNALVLQPQHGRLAERPEQHRQDTRLLRPLPPELTL